MKQLVIVGAGGMGRTFYSNALESVGYGNEFVIKGFINDYPSLGNFQNYPAIIVTIEDYEQVHDLWMKIHGFGIRSVDDSKEGVERFLKRNPTTSVVAVEDDKIVGAILCGHDGRRGCLYHVCVDEAYRMRGIGKAMVVFAMEALKTEGINNVSLIAFTKNDIGNAFWKEIGWKKREDLNYYDFILNEANITAFIQ